MHSIKGGMTNCQAEMKKAVDCGYWNLFRFNPQLADEGKNPFIAGVQGAQDRGLPQVHDGRGSLLRSDPFLPGSRRGSVRALRDRVHQALRSPAASAGSVRTGGLISCTQAETASIIKLPQSMFCGSFFIPVAQLQFRRQVCSDERRTRVVLQSYSRILLTDRKILTLPP